MLGYTVFVADNELIETHRRSSTGEFHVFRPPYRYQVGVSRQ